MLASTAMTADPTSMTPGEDPQGDLLREMYWARETAARGRMDTSEVRDRLHDLAAQLRTDETMVIPMGEGNLASPSRWRRQIKYRMWRVMRPATWRYDRLIADHAELTTSLAEKVMVLEAEVDRLKSELDAERSGNATGDRPDDRGAAGVRVAVLHPQTAFVRGGAETHAESLVKALKAAGHDADLVQIAGKWYPPSQLAHQMAVWRSFDITESNGLKVDAVIGLKFPAYLAQHERKVVWLIHQHRTAYELWDHPDYADLKRQDDGAAVRDMVWEADRVALGEAKRVFTNSSNVKDRLWNSLRIPAETLYHPSGVSERLLDREPGPYGEHILFPSRMESLKRQSLVIDAMKHVKTSVQLVLVGRGPDEPQLREQVERLGVGDRVTFEIGVSDERLEQLYLSALGVYFGPFDEDYGYVTLEGMAAERPVVTLTDSGGPLEFVRDDETGIVAPPEPRAIAEAFDRLHRDREAAARLGKAGNALIRAEVPRWPDVVARLLD